MNQTHHHDAAAPHPQPPRPENARDPVCGMSVSTATAKWKQEHAGQTYYFCNPRCAEKFRAEPDRYLAGPVLPAGSTAPADKAPPHTPEPAPTAGIYTCPMHPEVRQEGPGACPKCGMALEPIEPAPPAASRTEFVCPMHPQIGQLPGSLRTISGSIGQTYSVRLVAGAGSIGSSAMPHFGQAPGPSCRTSGSIGQV